jgi:hypothetical protein
MGDRRKEREQTKVTGAALLQPATTGGSTASCTRQRTEPSRKRMQAREVILEPRSAQPPAHNVQPSAVGRRQLQARDSTGCPAGPAPPLLFNLCVVCRCR